MKNNNKEQIPMKKESLIKYSTPFLVSVVQDHPAQTDIQPQSKQQQQHHYLQLRTEELLNKIIKPLEFRLDNNQLWRQTVMSTPATKTEVINLEEELDRRLVNQQAKQQGLCEVRQQLYEECFDELIRQITVDCKQRGLLLVKVRDEIKSQMKAYQQIYESSVAFGVRKVVDQEGAKIELQKQIQQLKKEEQELQNRVEARRKTIQAYRQQQEDTIQRDEQAHQINIQQAKQVNMNIKNQMDELLGRK